MAGEVKYVLYFLVRAWQRPAEAKGWRGPGSSGTAVKRAAGGWPCRASAPGRPEKQHVIAGEEPQPLSVDEAELELLRQFDLAWQYGPCTGENPLRPQERILETVLSSTHPRSKPSPCLGLLRLGGVEVPTHPSTHVL